MSHGTLVRRRSLTLLVALCIGFLGRVVAAVAVPLLMQMPQDTAALTSSATESGSCSACPRQRDVLNSPSMASICAVALCSVLPALLPPGRVVTRLAHAAFPSAAFSSDRGLTVRPDLRPHPPTTSDWAPLLARQGVPRPLSTAASTRPKCSGCGNGLISRAGGLDWWRGGICGS